MDAQMVCIPQDKRVDFCLLCPNDSLSREGIAPGDILFIRAGDVANGDLAAIEMDGETSVGYVWHTDDRLCISHGSPRYASKVLTGEELARARIVGAVVGWTHWRTTTTEGDREE